MKNNIFKIFAALALVTVLLAGCNKEKYAKINTDPSTIGEGNVSRFFTQAYLDFEPSSYLYWYYISKIVKRFDQVNGGSTSDTYNTMGELGGIGSQFVAVRRLEMDMKELVKVMDEADQPKYANILSMVNVLSCYLAVLDSDLYGSMPFTEACQARYGGTLTPKYDTQAELFTELLRELDEDIATFTNSVNQISPSGQDMMYGGDAAKWRKLANGVKLRIAVRLLHADKAKALAIAGEVAASEANIMTPADAFIYNKGRSGDNSMGDYAFHFGNGVEGMGTASKTIVDFMKKNLDPRVFIFYQKNDFNAEVVQAFFDAQAIAASTGEAAPEIPDYIMEEIDYEIDAATGKKVFKGWKGLGEPWVRIQGCPLGINISQLPEYRKGNNYFDSNLWQVKLDGKDKTYNPLSSQTERLVRGRVGTFTFPSAPGKTKQLAYSGGVPWYGMGITAGEMNLLLAELALAGASLPKSAAAYFEAGVRASAAEYNEYATKNQIPYIDADHCYDETDLPIAISGDQIDAMMESADYKLTGNKADDLEKVYIQQYLHYMYQPVEQFVTARRGGIPKKGSAYIPWNESYDATIIPRRLYVTTPNDTDVMAPIIKAAFAEQGFSFTTGDAGATLNTERVWYDKGAPQWGAGPNL